MGRTIDLPSVIELATAVEERNISQLDIKLQERKLNMF
jgi:hypothetical protein